MGSLFKGDYLWRANIFESKKNALQKNWFTNEDINSLEELIGRLKRLKEKVGFIIMKLAI
ncbi:hypothetical protein TanjilG_00197 [Lupinus angustifolius]|uniref:Uncharacterized protein n=1 Tax=Lupinus angustifolius TaxID=3871 RepID=A0A394D1Z0_LUPAN|nr:hypothetical protein TanjilG_00197 [Lupinus angustifolius]